MTCEQTVHAKRAAREEALATALLVGLPSDIADTLKVLDARTLISKLAAGEVTAELVTIEAIRK
jgi:hypothetical protein